MSVTLNQLQRVAGLVFVAVQDGRTGDEMPPTAAAQTEAILDKVSALLATDHLELVDVVKLTCFVTDGAVGAEVQRVLDRRFPYPLPPVTMQVNAELMHPASLVEIEAVADER